MSYSPALALGRARPAITAATASIFLGMMKLLSESKSIEFEGRSGSGQHSQHVWAQSQMWALRRGHLWLSPPPEPKRSGEEWARFGNLRPVPMSAVDHLRSSSLSIW